MASVSSLPTVRSESPGPDSAIHLLRAKPAGRTDRSHAPRVTGNSRQRMADGYPVETFQSIPLPSVEGVSVFANVAEVSRNGGDGAFMSFTDG